MDPIKGYYNNASKPEGIVGSFMVNKMNGGHSELTAWGSQFFSYTTKARVLDVGCGGGANIRSFLMRIYEGRVDGVDYSKTSVEAAQGLNAHAIAVGRCRIQLASADLLPFAEDSYDLITAIETVYFWPDMAAAFAEMLRVLAPGGLFVVVNESTGIDESAQHFAGIIDGMKLYTAEQIRSFMEQAGFENVAVHEADDRPWICVVGAKPNAGSNETVSQREAGPEYGDWVSDDKVKSFAAVGAGLAGGAVLAGALRAPKAVTAVFGAAAVGCGAYAGWHAFAHRKLSYEGKSKLTQKIVEKTTKYVTLPEGGTCLDIGCGAGELTIAVARRNPQATVVGVDSWDDKDSPFSKELCERNAAAEGVTNVRFEQANTLSLPFEDESFDAVVSNHVYQDKLGLRKRGQVSEMLRCLKKGGTFAIHDTMGKIRYGNMKRFCQQLRDAGYEDVRFMSTCRGRFITRSEGRALMLRKAKLLCGTK